MKINHCDKQSIAGISESIRLLPFPRNESTGLRNDEARQCGDSRRRLLIQILDEALAITNSMEELMSDNPSRPNVGRC